MPSLPGFRDFYPEECAARNVLFSTWRTVATRYGFTEYDGPPLEELELYTKKSGEEIAGQLYHFVDKGERAVALRPEITPTLARMVTARHRNYKKPLKWFSIPQVFRYERMQRGRLREHFQLNCDLLGEPSLEADIEVIALCIDVLRAFGLTSHDFVVRLSDRQFWTDFLIANGIAEVEWYAIFQAIDKSEREPREVTRQKLGVLADPIVRVLDEGAPSERLDTVERGLAIRGLGAYAKRDFTIVRGLAYYTGIVFEAFDRSGEFRAIGGGGRYDNLLKNLGGFAMPALGFGMGDVVLGELLKARGKTLAIAPKLDTYLIIADETVRDLAVHLVQQLRNKGESVDYPLSPTKLGKQWELAQARGAARAVIVDEQMHFGKLQITELASRQQRTALVDELVQS